MDITISQENARVPVTVFKVVGRMNMGTVEEFEKQVRQAYEVGARNMIFDLSGLVSLTSAGLRTMLATAKLLAGASGKSQHLKLAAPVSDVRQVLTIAGFDAIMEIHDSVSSALASF
jgi:anti-anti-sigma factor